MLGAFCEAENGRHAATDDETESCQSGRMGHPAKVLYPHGYRGFESLTLRQPAPRLRLAGQEINTMFSKRIWCFSRREGDLDPWVRVVAERRPRKTKDRSEK